MRYNKYKRMTKEHREEYDYHFSGDFWWIGQSVFAAVAVLSQDTEIILLFGVFSLTMWIVPLYLEYKWLKEHNYD